MLTYLCAEVRGFVDSCFGGEWTPLMNMLWQLLLRTTDAYVQWKVIPRSGAGDGEELEGADAVDSDGMFATPRGLPNLLSMCTIVNVRFFPNVFISF